MTRFASIQQSVKIIILEALLSHLELDHRQKQGGHRKNGMDRQVKSRQEFPTTWNDTSHNVKGEKKLTWVTWFLWGWLLVFWLI